MTMTNDDLEYLCGEQAVEQIKQNLHRDALQVAMDKNVMKAHLIASQVKYLQKARLKLPSYFKALCVIPTIGFEQCSSEKSAETKEVGGEICVDLTCGLGVDSLHFSRHFKKVITVERDPVMAQIARINFERMRITNIEVVNSSAEEFIENCDLKVDLIYADPDRRGAKGKKQVLLEDCSPNMLALLDKLKQISPKIMIKCSPLFDVEEAFRLFGTHTRVEVISLAGECKEVVIETGDHITSKELKVNAIGLDKQTFNVDPEDSAQPINHPFEAQDTDQYKYLTLPDVVLQKSRCARRFYGSQPGAIIESDNSCVLSPQALDRPFGKVFRIEKMDVFNPKKLKKEFKSQGLRKIEILKRNFDLSSEQICAQLGVKHGGSKQIIFTMIQNQRYVIFVNILD